MNYVEFNKAVSSIDQIIEMMKVDPASISVCVSKDDHNYRLQSLTISLTHDSNSEGESYLIENSRITISI